MIKVGKGNGTVDESGGDSDGGRGSLIDCLGDVCLYCQRKTLRAPVVVQTTLENHAQGPCRNERYGQWSYLFLRLYRGGHQ